MKKHQVCVDAEGTKLNFNEIYFTEYTFNGKCFVYSQDNSYKGRCSLDRFEAPNHKYWKQGNGELIKIKDMSVDHLINTVDMLDRWARGASQARQDVAAEFLYLMKIELRHKQHKKPNHNNNYNKQKKCLNL